MLFRSEDSSRYPEALQFGLVMDREHLRDRIDLRVDRMWDQGFVAEVDHDWTMKYYLKRGDEIILRPANKKYPDIRPRQELNVAGVVTSVIRKYR